MSRLSASTKGDNERLIASLKKMRDENTWIVVEHDEDTMRDYLIDALAQVPVSLGRDRCSRNL